MKVQHLYDVDKSNQPSKKLKNRLPPTHQGLTYLLSPLILSWVKLAWGKRTHYRKKMLPC